MSHRLLRALGATCAVLLLGTGVVGLLHVPAFRAVLMAAGGCPIGGDASATAAQREATRRSALQGERGVTTAPVTSFFGLSLGTTTRAEVERRVADHAVCTANTSDLVLECVSERLSDFGVDAPGTTFFRFDAQQHLVAVVVMPKRVSLDGSLRAFEHFSTTLTAALGPAHRNTGNADARALAPLMAQARREHHFSDLITRVVASNLGDGVQVIVEAQWLPAQLAAR
jgi:hypothetical protein